VIGEGSAFIYFVYSVATLPVGIKDGILYSCGTSFAASRSAYDDKIGCTRLEAGYGTVSGWSILKSQLSLYYNTNITNITIKKLRIKHK